jgi:lipopolysaccharide transport system permease protein
LKTIIDSRSANFLDIKEILRFKDLLWNLSKRDVLIRYKQTVIGVLWAVIRPLINIVIFGLIAQFIERAPSLSDKFITVSAGVVLWTMISAAISDISNSMIANSNILTKVYFPKIIIPLSSLTVCLIDFFISFVILLIFRLIYLGLPGLEILLLPFFILYALIFSFSIGLFFASLNIKYRDVKFVIPFLIQIGFYVCPIFLSLNFYLDKLPENLEPIFLLNPLVTIIQGFKYSFLGEPMMIPAMYIYGSLAITLVLLFLSMRYFVKFEKTFADFV